MCTTTTFFTRSSSAEVASLSLPLYLLVVVSRGERSSIHEVTMEGEREGVEPHSFFGGTEDEEMASGLVSDGRW